MHLIFIFISAKILAPDQKERLLLSASTAKERKDWLRAFWKQLYLKKGGGMFFVPISPTSTTPPTPSLHLISSARWIDNNKLY